MKYCNGMKKLLYLIPVLLIALCLTPFALYKDTVKPGSSLDTASPSYWKVSVQISMSGSLTELSSSTSTPATITYTQNATFRGFPFGAYFNHSSSSTTTNSSSSSAVSGWSWLWGLVDLSIIASTFYLAVRINRKTAQ
jgi:hypothetical protein